MACSCKLLAPLQLINLGVVVVVVPEALRSTPIYKQETLRSTPKVKRTVIALSTLSKESKVSILLHGRGACLTHVDQGVVHAGPAAAPRPLLFFAQNI